MGRVRADAKYFALQVVTRLSTCREPGKILTAAIACGDEGQAMKCIRENAWRHRCQ